MQIQFVQNCHYYLPSRCPACGSCFSPDTILVAAMTDDDVELGLLCESCAHAGCDELHAQMLHYATVLQQRATTLRRLATETVHVVGLGAPVHSRGELVELG